MAYVKQPDGSVKWVSPTGAKPPVLGQIGGAIQNMGAKIGNDWTSMFQGVKDRNAQADADRNARMMAAYSAKNPTTTGSNPTQITGFDPYAASGIKPPTTSSSGSLSFFDPNAASLDAQIAAAGPAFQANLEKAKQQFNQQPVATSTTSTDTTATGTTSTGTTATGAPDFLSLFQAYVKAGADAATASQLARRDAAESTYAAQLKNAQTAAKQNQLAAQQGRQQIAEGSFTQERQLLQAASQRGLGGSGIEQLAQTQQRIGAGQQINQLVQQEMLGNEKLQNYLGDVAAQKDTKIAEADAQYYNDLFKLAGNDLENMKFLDSTQYRDKVFDWQKDNAAETLKTANLNTRIDLINALERTDLSDTAKKSITAMMIEAGVVPEAEGNKLIKDYIGTAAGENIVSGKFDWTAAILTGGLAAVGLTAATIATGGTIWGAILPALAAGGAVGTVGGMWKSLTDSIDFELSDGGEWKGTRAEAIDKNNTNSVVSREFGNRPGFRDIEYFLDGTIIKYKYGGTVYDKFNQAQLAWQSRQG
jgi:hypothetical protein